MAIGNTDIAGNRYDRQLSYSAWWSGNPKVGLDLFIMEIMMIMILTMIMMMTMIMVMIAMTGMRMVW